MLLLPLFTSALPSLPAALNVTFPLAYMQSAFVTGHRAGVPAYDTKYGNINPTLSSSQRLSLLRQYASNATSFRGGEIFINTMETAEALADVRAMNRLILQVAEETGTPPFYGFWIPSRLPGMWWPANYTQQPQSFRAKALMSSGSMWTRYPTEPAPGTSILNLQGTDLDITSAEAVGLAMRNLHSVLRSECEPAAECAGPLVGSYLFSEAALTPLYEPFKAQPYANVIDPSVGNISDLQPPVADGQPPLLRMGNASELYTDSKVEFSMYQGPKRTVPLFSLSARDSFALYCARRGMPHVSTLPADRAEFNDDGATVKLPSHARFVPLNASVWPLWEDWVMQTWFDYCERTVLTVNDAQQHNPYFGGAFLFQLAGWYSIRARAKRPVSYDFRDGNGTLQRQFDEIVADWPHYGDMNPVVKGQDLEMFANASWLTGFIHEASHGVPHIGIDPPMLTPREDRDRFFMASDRHRHFVNAQGTMAREIMAAHNKIFGVFARAAFINDPTYNGSSVGDTLTAAGFEQMWSFSTSLLHPDVVSTLGDFRFLQKANLPFPPLQTPFELLFRELSSFVNYSLTIHEHHV